LGKSLELLKEAVPSLARVTVVFNPELAVTRTSYLASIEEAATALGVSPIRTPVRTAVGVVRALDALAAEPNGGVLMLPPPPTTFIRDTIFELAAQHRLPLVVNTQAEAAAGGLLAYATDTADLSRRAAVYVDRLLRGTKVNELPVQLPTKFQLMVNLKTAKAIGLTIPETLLARADKIIE
jgi:putative ABC transport system substrate-binding protein